MTLLGAQDFGPFFRAIHGYEPFPWQSALVEQILSQGRWPDLLDLPTGSGKTSAIDVALFTLAARPDLFPRRIVLVVDRRVIVDQGALHARKIQSRLLDASEDAVQRVAVALRALSSDDVSPFTISVLRGGMPRDEAWARTPDSPVVVVSTVDQVGSRILFRGYGVSPRMAPIHAGLLGNDALILLDEVQLSTAFAETLDALHRRWRKWHTKAGGVALPDRWAAVPMSATPIRPEREGDWRFELQEDDHEHPVLARRLAANKLACLRSVKVTGDEDARRDRFAAACAEAIREHLQAGARTLAVVVNRVDGARRVHQGLLDPPKKKQKIEADVVLLTGRMRPLDREEILGNPEDPTSLLGRLAAGRLRDPAARPLIVVATQSIEAGADFDFDALVTECASLDALRQRFGRLDRGGELGESRATILVRHDQVGDKADDPIYGKALAATWDWLEKRASDQGDAAVDFGIEAFPDLSAQDLEPLCSPLVHAPILLPAHLDAWAQTNPRPEPDPEVALWLHGPDRGVKEVRIVWRGDVDGDLLNGERTKAAAHLEELLPSLTACPPSSLESLSLPIAAARAFLELGTGALESFGDVEGERSNDDTGDDEDSRRCVRFTADGAQLATARELRPEETIVVPASYGGISHGNWDPAAKKPVFDLGDWANLRHRGRLVVRLHPSVLAGSAECSELDQGTKPVRAWCTPARARTLPRMSDGEDDAFDQWTAIRDWTQSLGDDSDPRLERLLEFLVDHRQRTRPSLIPLTGRWIGILGRRRAPASVLPGVESMAAADVVSEDDDSGSFTGIEVTLPRHLGDVRDQARAFAKHLSLPDELAEDLALAAWLHDAGKADPRFQTMLVGGDEIRAALIGIPLAKSAAPSGDVMTRRKAAERARYPKGYRHELLSVDMLQRTPEALKEAHDPDLVLHLVGSHHGWCRPFAPAVDHGDSMEVGLELDGMWLHGDTAHGLARIDSGITDRFWDLVERYGWWGLAWLEAILRLADHRASEAPTLEGQPIPQASTRR